MEQVPVPPGAEPPGGLGADPSFMTASQYTEVEEAEAARARQRQRGAPVADSMASRSTAPASASLSASTTLMAHEYDKTDYWRSWVAETRDSAAAEDSAAAARRRRTKREKAEAKKGLKGVKLEIQWEWDHPFAVKTRTGKGRGPLAFIDSDEPRFRVPDRGYFSELADPAKLPRAPGGTFSNTGRLDMQRLYLGKELNKSYIEPGGAGPGQYDSDVTGFGKQALSTKHTAASFSIGSGGGGANYKTDGPGPVYVPKMSELVYGHSPAFLFTTDSSRDLVRTAGGHETPGAKYNLPEPPGKGPAFTFGKSVSKGAFATDDDASIESSEDEDALLLSRPPVAPPKGFGFGCNIEEHVKYGHCLDGQCSMRSNWENIGRREADLDRQRRKEALERSSMSHSVEKSASAPQLKPLSATSPWPPQLPSVDESKAKDDAELSSRASSAPKAGEDYSFRPSRQESRDTSEAGDDGAGSRVANRRAHSPLVPVANRSDAGSRGGVRSRAGSAMGSRSGKRGPPSRGATSGSRGGSRHPSSRGTSTRGSRGRSHGGTPTTAGHSGVATVNTVHPLSRYRDVGDLPNTDVFSHNCPHCHKHVMLLTRRQRIAAINSRVARNHKHLIRPVHLSKRSVDGFTYLPGSDKDTDAASYTQSLKTTALAPRPDGLSMAESVAFTPRSDVSVELTGSRAIDWPPSSSRGSVGGGSVRSGRSGGRRHGPGTWSGASAGSAGSTRGLATARSAGARSGARDPRSLIAAGQSGRRGRGARGGGAGAQSEVPEGVVHDPSRVVYIPGAGFFCSHDHVKKYVLANVGPSKGGAKTMENAPRKAVLLTARDGHVSNLSDLLLNASDIEIRDENARTGLHLASAAGHAHVIDRLLCGSFNVLRYQICMRHHPPHCACFNQNLDVNATDNEGKTALHLAAENGHAVCIERLLSAGADAQVLDNRGRAAHDVAENQECFHLCKSSTEVADVADLVRDAELRREELERVRGLSDDAGAPVAPTPLRGTRAWR